MAVNEAEVKAKKRVATLAILAGVVLFVNGALIIWKDPHAWVNWVGGLCVILAGVLLEERFFLRDGSESESL
jgi:drug/metabolite transporter (DMT)-like permease